ncbi:MAG TPA: type I-D CRISPR-associated endonuclease Cas1d [Ktedonobacteraceae bacterium]
MPTLYLTEEYALVRREGEDVLLVQIPARRARDGAASIPARNERIPLMKVDEVIVLGEVTLTASALHLLLEHDVEITFLGRYGQFKGRLSPPFSKNAVLRMAQYRTHQNMVQRCELARRFVMGKLANQRQRLLRLNRTLADHEVGQAIGQLATAVRTLETLPLLPAEPVQSTTGGDNRVQNTPLATILGIEGAGSAAYFRCFGKFLSRHDLWSFPGRVKRPPTDPVNALLSFGYALLAIKCASVVQLIGLDHFVGYLHSTVYGRPALALDLMEEFRPLIVDATVLSIFNNRMLTSEDFMAEMGTCRLKPEKHSVLFVKLEERLNEEVTHPLFGYRTTYRRSMELQGRLLAKWLTGEIEAYTPFFMK